MKVKELIEALKQLDPELPVLIAKDDEGNGYHHAYYLPSEYFCPELDKYNIETVYSKDNFEDAVENEHEPIVNCVVL